MVEQVGQGLKFQSSKTMLMRRDEHGRSSELLEDLADVVCDSGDLPQIDF